MGAVRAPAGGLRSRGRPRAGGVPRACGSVPMNRPSAADRLGPARADILRCVHCGLCLSSCPTYRVTKLEPESPRGRIYLMRALEEGRLEPSRDMARHL